MTDSDSHIFQAKNSYDIFNMMDAQNSKKSCVESQHDNTDLQLLLNKVRQGDQQAFGQLYDTTVNLLYAIALRISRNHDMAEEIINETYMQLWQQASKYDSTKSTIKSWLVMLCRSRAIDALRRNRHNDAQQLDDEMAITDDSTLPDLMISIERESRLHQELEKLSNTQRQLLSLSFFRGFTHNELADFLDLPLGTVKTQIRRSIIQLKENMAVGEEI